MLIAALFTIGRTWQKPRCTWTDEWIQNIWYIQTPLFLREAVLTWLTVKAYGSVVGYQDRLDVLRLLVGDSDLKVIAAEYLLES